MIQIKGICKKNVTYFSKIHVKTYEQTDPIELKTSGNALYRIKKISSYGTFFLKKQTNTQAVKTENKWGKGTDLYVSKWYIMGRENLSTATLSMKER